MKTKIIYYSFFLFLVITISSWLAINVTKNMLRENQRQQNSSDFFMHDVKYTQINESGAVQNQLQAPQIMHYPQTDIYVFKSPQLTMIDKDGHLWNISANNGLSKKNNQEIDLWDNVNINQQDKKTGQNKMHITTSAATIHPQKNLANTDKPLTITQGRNTVNAVGAEVDFHASTVKLLSQVKGQYEK